MDDPTDILNWRRLDEHISLSGQPTKAQFGALQQLGVGHVINLAPQTHKDALADEAGVVAGLGMGYVHIPVDFAAPAEAEYAAFCAAIQGLRGQKIHVHCIYNARVSAFFYRYAKDGNGLDRAKAFAVMDGIWRPGGVWAAFIGDSAATDLPHRYAGPDY